jgi:hypothetical protein
VANPDFIMGSEIDSRFFRVAVLVAERGITRLTNLLSALLRRSMGEGYGEKRGTYLKGHFADFCIRLSR